jgi:hypothetical protein
MYNLIANCSPNVSKQFSNFDEDDIIDTENVLYYKYIKLFYTKSINVINEKDYQLRVISLLNYPDILQKVKFTDVEILILSSILDFSIEINYDLLLSKIENFLNNNERNFLCSNTSYMAPLLLMRLSKYYGVNNKLDKVEYYCKKGIESFELTRNIYLIEYFYYYLALVYHNTNRMKDFEQSVYQCFNAIYIQRNKDKIRKFSNLILNDFSIIYEEFMIRYLIK